jgi:hypothetical protein
MIAGIGFVVVAAVDEVMAPLELFDTHYWDQKRLPQELQIARLTTKEAVNRFLSDVFLPCHDAAFA